MPTGWLLFTVHIPDVALAAAVQDCARPEAPEIDEIALTGLVTVTGRFIDCPRLSAAPVAMECVFERRIDLGPAREIVLGTVRGLFIRDTAVDADLRVDPGAIDAIGRLGGPVFATTRDRFGLA